MDESRLEKALSWKKNHSCFNLLMETIKNEHSLKYFSPSNDGLNRAVVVAQLAEQSLPTPEIRGSNPNIGNEVFGMYLSVNCI